MTVNWVGSVSGKVPRPGEELDHQTETRTICYKLSFSRAAKADRPVAACNLTGSLWSAVGTMLTEC